MYCMYPTLPYIALIVYFFNKQMAVTTSSENILGMHTKEQHFARGWWPTKHLETRENGLATDVERNPITDV